jgi:signal transduction histidine kinase
VSADDKDLAIHRANSEWRVTFDAIDTPIIVLDRALRVRRLNRAAQSLAGRDLSRESFAQSIGLSLIELGAGQPWLQAAELAARAGQTLRHESAQVTAGNTTWDIALHSGDDSEQSETRLIVVARDISPLVALQESLRKTETMAALGAIVGGVAHEVRNPLFGISATLDAFESRFHDRDEYRPYSTVLRAEVRRMSQLMRELLDYGRPIELSLSPGSLAAVVAEAIYISSAVAELEKVRVDNLVPQDLPPISMDRERLAQALHNLVHNAIQHTPAGGVVTVSAEAKEDSGARWLVCSVRDRGPGFEAADLGKVFEPFFTRRRGGV